MGMGTVGRTVGLNNLSMRMTLEHWGKAKVVEAQLANIFSFGKGYSSEKHGYPLW